MLSRRGTISIISCLLIAIVSACQKEYSDSSYHKYEKYSLQKYYRSHEEAIDLAINSISLLDGQNSTCNRTIQSLKEYKAPTAKAINEQSEALLYVINFEDNQGFSIIAANKSISPVIAVTESGHYIPGEPSGIDAFDQYMNSIIAELSLQDIPDTTDHDDDPYYSYYRDWYQDSGRPAIINTQWGQGNIYGSYCPNNISGCVATAIAQIMAYHEYPDSLHISCDMEGDYVEGDVLFFDWDLIKQHESTHNTLQNCNPVHKQISALLREIGVRANMQYYSDGSAPMRTPITILPKLGYRSDYFTQHPNISDIQSSLDHNMPILVSVDSSVAGHEWIADGYKDRHFYRNVYIKYLEDDEYEWSHTEDLGVSHYVHMNWGWDGDCNGYFLFGSYETSGGEIYDTYHTVEMDFGRNVRMLFNIMPDIY